VIIHEKAWGREGGRNHKGAVAFTSAWLRINRRQRSRWPLSALHINGVQFLRNGVLRDAKRLVNEEAISE
jgi:hypothetical protein